VMNSLRGVDVETTVVSQLRVERQGRRKAHRYNLVLPVIVRNTRQQSLNLKSKDVSTWAVVNVGSIVGLMPAPQRPLTVQARPQ